MMAAKSLVFLLAACSASALASEGTTKQQSLEKAWSHDLANSSVSPIKRVVGLLQKMRSELDAEAKNEAEMYDKMVCWCETNEKEKTKAIETAEVKSTDLEAEIGSRSGNHGKLSTEIVAMKKQIEADTQALDQATAIREKEAATFRDEEKEMVQSITNLKNAVMVLEKHQGGAASLMQLEPAVRASVRAVLRDVSVKYDLLLGDTPRGRKTRGAALLAVDQQPLGLHKASLLQELGEASDELPLNIAEHMLSTSAGKATTAFVQSGKPASYNSASGEIFGVLRRMKEEFEADLSQKQKDEAKSAEDFAAMSQAKSSQISIAKEKLDAMESEHASNQKALSDAKEDLEATRKQRSVDVEFLRNLRVTCQGIDKEWQQRSETRSQELLAVSEALKMLTDDDTREHLAKTVSFLQTDAATEAQMRQKLAAKALRKAARDPTFEADDLLDAWSNRGGVSSPKAQLGMLAVTAELDSFTEVKEAMDKMTADLKAQQAEEVTQKAYCEKELNGNEQITYEKTEDKKDLEAELETLAATIGRLETEIAAAKDQIAETKVQTKKASESREKENAEFQQVVSDQRATQAILEKVLARLESFYKKKASLLQRSAKAVLAQEPPVKFNKLKSNAGASGVLGMIEQIVEDSKKLEAEAMDGEQQAQKDYESFVKDSNSVVAQGQAAVTSKTDAIADAKLATEEASSNHQSTQAELESLASYKADLHKECDFLLKNFNVRQQARTQEIEAIQSAKAILSGAASA